MEETERLLGLSLDRFNEESNRVQLISQKLRLAGRDLCDSELSPVLGAAVFWLSNGLSVLEPLAEQRYGDGEDGGYVMSVFPGMAAARAGLAEGDIIVSIDGEKIKHAGEIYRPDVKVDEPVRVEVRRGDEQISLVIENELGCRYYAIYSRMEWENAFADGVRMVIISALLRKLPSDSALAMLIGHELAHNIFRDASSRRRFVKRKEKRADYVGIYLAAMAGYPVEDEVGRRGNWLRDINRLGERWRTHPMDHARELAFRKTIDEIQAKRAAGQPLVPATR